MTKTPNFSTPDSQAVEQTGLLRYAPHCGDRAKVVAYVWRRDKRVQWESPCLAKTAKAFNPQPFMTRYPNAICEVVEFERVMSWFDALCFSARDLVEVEAACDKEMQLGLTLRQHPAIGTQIDVSTALEEGVVRIEAMSKEHFNATLVVSLESLLRDCQEFRDFRLEVLTTHPYACARIHTLGRKVLIYIDQKTDQNHVVPRLVRENAALERKGDNQQHSLIVFTSLRGESPVALTPRVTGTGLNFMSLSKSLARFIGPRVGDSGFLSLTSTAK